ncbi:MAG TPA: AAA family ATPase [Thermoanaerobaculia bacterium]|nr:AAA family ATPase [Thermoanaerobaculia bacterium]
MTRELSAQELNRRCDPAQFAFGTTAELEADRRVFGQERAVSAIELSLEIAQEDFNLFALGPAGTGKHTVVGDHLDRLAPTRPAPSDLCYVNNFEDAARPSLLELPAGAGRRLARDMDQLIEDVPLALRQAFESEEYQQRREALMQEGRETAEGAFEEARRRAAEKNVAILRTPGGMALAPTKDGEVISPDELEDEQKAQLERVFEEIQEQLRAALRQMPRAERAQREKGRALDREVTGAALEPLFEELRRKHHAHAGVLSFLRAVEQDLLRDPHGLVEEGTPLGLFGSGGDGRQRLRGYRVNVVVDHAETQGAPVVHEEHPTYENLMGRIDHRVQMGALTTDYMLIRSGALHRARGGYLLLEAEKVLMQPYAWEGLKRALATRRIRVEPLGRALGLISTTTLEPEPAPLEVRVVLFGSPLLYYLLGAYDTDFQKLFKVAADFDDQMPLEPESRQLYAHLLARIGRDAHLLPLDRTGVARMVEESSRIAGDAERLTALTGRVSDLLKEADHWARREGGAAIAADHVARAAASKEARSDRVRERIHREILRGSIFIDSDRARGGQVNGLAAAALGDYTFGYPVRITARTSMGKDGVLDIEREVELGGPIHSKGVLILSGFLSGRYASNEPLSLSASLVFEQSYGGVEGDSASSAELYALLSAISGLPLRQDLAVTGSVDQHGRVQPIGAVNEKVEGFFDVCAARGLTGSQGVLIPEANVKHLMLRPRVVEAVERGTFHVYAIATVDEGIALLTGAPAGDPDEHGAYPEGTVNRAVSERLGELGRRLRELENPTPVVEPPAGHEVAAEEPVVEDWSGEDAT